MVCRRMLPMFRMAGWARMGPAARRRATAPCARSRGTVSILREGQRATRSTLTGTAIFRSEETRMREIAISSPEPAPQK